MDSNCQNCYFYKGKLCYRYPTLVEKEPTDFCGEFRSKSACEDVIVSNGLLLDSEFERF